jgi:hypothetical protein
VYFSKHYSKCKKGTKYPNDLCANPEKYAKSLKAMEYIGTVQTVLSIWETVPNAYCQAIVLENDEKSLL